MPKNTLCHTSIAAAWMLLGKEIVPHWSSWPKTASEILDLTGAGRSQAYEMMGRLREFLSTILGKPGRPASAPVPGHSLLAVSKAIQGYLLRHPGAAYQQQNRLHYTDPFRRYVVGLVEAGQPGEGLSVAELAEASEIPLGTLKEWFSQDAIPDLAPPVESSLKQEHRHQIITLFQGWKGTFEAFCRMVREQHRLNYGMTFIGNLLHHAGLRQRKAHRPKQAVWSRDTFRRLFPGAQWLGDGSSIKVQGIAVQWGYQTFVFNLEVILDVASNALVGVAVSDHEDEEVLLRAYRDAVTTTGEAPLALSLDNRASNHTPAVIDTLGETNTALLPTTLGRGQSKAPLEGTFGLFNQEMPALLVGGDNPKERARSILKLAFTAWARGRNGRPRKKLGNMSPAAFYRSACPTLAEIEEARRWIETLRQRQEQLRRTREERADKVKLAFLKQALAQLGIADPGDRLAIALAYYCRDAIVNGLSIFQSRLQLGTLPPGALPGRYLAGIIRNAHDQAEFASLVEFQIKNRERLRDMSLRTLLDEDVQLQQACPSPEPLVRALVDRALAAPCAIDYHFWSLRCASAISEVDPANRVLIYRNAARRIGATFKADRWRKQSLLARLAKAAVES